MMNIKRKILTNFTNNLSFNCLSVLALCFVILLVTRYQIVLFSLTVISQVINIGIYCSENNCRLWNPHILLASRLQERFNKQRSLIGLVQYLIDSVAPLSALHSFTRIRLQSLRAFCQMMCYDAALALSLQVCIC